MRAIARRYSNTTDAHQMSAARPLILHVTHDAGIFCGDFRGSLFKAGFRANEMWNYQVTMNKRAVVALLRASVEHERGNGSRNVEMISIADQKRARCLRYGLLLANALAWLFILAAFKWSFFN